MREKGKHILRTIIASALAFAVTFTAAAQFSTPCYAAESDTFADVSSAHWAYRFVERAYSEGAVSGTYYDGTTRLFSPDDPLKLDEWATMVTKSYWPDEIKAEPAGSTWYSKFETVAGRHGLTNNLPAGVGMEDKLTRYDMAVVTENALRAAGAKMPVEAELEAARARVGDWNIIPENYRNAVATMVAWKIISGVNENGDFSGEETFSRAQAATVYCHMTDVVPSLGVEPEPEIKPGACCPADKNADGIVTEDEVLAMIPALKEKYPNNGDYDPDDAYYSVGFPHVLGMNCGWLALHVSDDIFGKLPSRTHHDISKARPGDVIWLQGQYNHMEVILEHPYLDDMLPLWTFDCVSGGNTGGIGWGLDQMRDDYTEYTIYTRYNDGKPEPQPETQPEPKPAPKPYTGACCPADKNADGIVTEDEVLAMVNTTIKEKYPDNSYYDPRDTYYSKAFPGVQGVNSGWVALHVSDDLFGDMPCRTHHDMSKARPGDILWTHGYANHMEVILDHPHRDTIDNNAYEFGSLDGNTGGGIGWGQGCLPDFMDDYAYTIYTRYNDGQ